MSPIHLHCNFQIIYGFKNIQQGSIVHALIPVLGKQKDLCVFKAGLVYIINSKTARTTQGDPASRRMNEGMNEHNLLLCS